MQLCVGPFPDANFSTYGFDNSNVSLLALRVSSSYTAAPIHGHSTIQAREKTMDPSLLLLDEVVGGWLSWFVCGV